MIRLGCVLAPMSPMDLPNWVLDGASELNRVFATASAGDIDLRVTVQTAPASTLTSRSAQAYDLHQATRRLTANPAPPQRAANVAVLFAGVYAGHPDVLGIMFDRGFETSDDPSGNDKFTRSPREGCAVFLDAIRSRRPEDADYELETRFTTIHEAGHLFNLQHVKAPPNFMASSPKSAPYKEDLAFSFTSSHCEMLSACSTSSNVWPGGAVFSDTGPFANHNSLPIRQEPTEFGLELGIDMQTREFWPFEPVELDIELRVAPGVTRSFDVPDQIDPGYDAFVVWIEEPTGERRRYRSPRRYCGGVGRLRILPGRPFLRDISLFGEAGGYTFERSGIHRIWAEFEVRPGRIVRSAQLELNVLPARPSPEYEAARAALTPASRSKLLYHRVLRAEMEPAALSAYAKGNTGRVPIGSIEYALGRSMIAASNGVEPDQQPGLKQSGIALLERAIHRAQLGLNQRRWIVRLLGDGPTDPP